MKKVLITGSGGLVGSEACFFFRDKKFKIIGIENNTRKKFFGKAGDISKNYNALKKEIKNFRNYNVDIRDKNKLEKVFQREKKKLDLIIHCAAQPSHDYSYDNPVEDFNVNAKSSDFRTLKTTLKKYFKSKKIKANMEAIDTFNDYNFVDQITMICPLANNEKQLLLETTSISKREKLLQTILDSYISEEYISDISKH